MAESKIIRKCFIYSELKKGWIALLYVDWIKLIWNIEKQHQFCMLT